MTFSGNFQDGKMFFAAMVTLIWNIVQLSIFGIFLPGVDHLQLYQLLICIFIFLSFEKLL